MRRRRQALGLALTLALMVTAAVSSAQVQRRPLDTARAMSGTSAVVAAGTDIVVAWLDDTAARRRVMAATPDGAENFALGPAGGGDDGAPTTVATADGSVWVMASRAGAARQDLWLQRRTSEGWSAALPGPQARPFDHHPALAAAGDELWAVWLGDGSRNADATTLFAARWNGRAWSGAEALPRTLGAPMAPALTVDAAGAPTAVWAASDGTDAEIWASTRNPLGWSTPRALTRNQTPDIMPSIATTPDGLLVAWIAYHPDGYRPVAAIGSAAGWSEPMAIDEVPGSRVRAAVVDGRPAIFWRRLEFAPAGGTITARSLRDGRWSAAVDIASASGSPFGVASAADGRVALAFSRPDGRLGLLVGNRQRGGGGLAALASSGNARYGAVNVPARPIALPSIDSEPRVPNNYTGFGDSITNGVVYTPERVTSGGYRDPLQTMLRAYFRTGTVFNAGVDGEFTADGVGRIDNAIRAQESEAILIMEGTNDISAVVEVDTIAFNLRRMVQRSLEENPGIMPFLAQIPPRLDPGPEGFDGPGNGRTDELNAMLVEIAEQEGAVLVDQNTPLEADRSLMSNPLHPSAAGYEIMAEQWFAAIQPSVLANTNRGDVDGSGRVDGIDLVRLALAFGALLEEERYDAAADINGDGRVDGFDLDLLIEFFGTDVSTLEEGGA